MVSVGRAWGRHFLALETLAACGGGLAVAAWGSWWGGWATLAAALDQNRAAFYGAVASVAGSLLGFAIAALAIALAALDSRRLQGLRQSGLVGALVDVFTAATLWLGGTTALAVVALLADRDAAPRPPLFYLVVIGLFASGAVLARSVWVLRQLIGITTAPSKARPGDA